MSLSQLARNALCVPIRLYQCFISPGLGRKLTRPEHYEAVKGQKISVKLFRANEYGTKEFSGILTGREGNTITVETENGTVNFEASAASTVRLCDDEDLFD